MANDPNEKGYGDGYHDKEYNNEHEVTNPIERTLLAVGDIMTGNAFGMLQEADQKAESYRNSYSAGEHDRKEGK